MCIPTMTHWPAALPCWMTLSSHARSDDPAAYWRLPDGSAMFGEMPM